MRNWKRRFTRENFEGGKYPKGRKSRCRMLVSADHHGDWHRESMKGRLHKTLFIAAIIWATLPWLFSGAYAFHRFEHADPFWLLSMPLVMISFLPGLLAGPGENTFSLGWVATCSAFNLLVGMALAWGCGAASRRRRPPAISVPSSDPTPAAVPPPPAQPPRQP